MIRTEIKKYINWHINVSGKIWRHPKALQYLGDLDGHLDYTLGCSEIGNHHWTDQTARRMMTLHSDCTGTANCCTHQMVERAVGCSHRVGVQTVADRNLEHWTDHMLDWKQDSTIKLVHTINFQPKLLCKITDQGLQLQKHCRLIWLMHCQVCSSNWNYNLH